MSRQSEEILLQVPYVKHKKNDGTLYLMAERLGWMMQSRDQFSIIHKYLDVKSQKISPEGKAKIQLQIVLHDGNSTTFHFVHPDGQPAMIRERDKVKDMLQNLLPKFKKKVNKELEARHRLLSENPGLLQLYKDLVITSILTAEEFWAQHANYPHSKMKGGAPAKQDVGVAGDFMAEIKPQADGANGLRYNLTPDIIESIFKTYPAVRRKHLDNVPNKMTETEFWTKFFQSHYFHRDRVHHNGIKDIFTECAKDDDHAIKAQLKAGVNDKIANITQFNDSTLHENYGVDDGKLMGGSGSNSLVHRNIIKRFNQHSIMVMKANEALQGEEPANGKEPQTPGPSQKSTGDPKSSDSQRKRLREKLNYEDLDAPEPKKEAPLNLSKVERYLTGPTPASQTECLTMDDIKKSRSQLHTLLHSFEQGNSASTLTSERAVNALVDLSPGGSLMKSGRQDVLAEQCPDHVHADLRLLYGSLAELSRHFWGCFPPTTAQLMEKATKMYDTLKKFQQLKVRPFENELARTYSTMSSPLTNHINQMLEVMFRKYTNWKQKKIPGLKAELIQLATINRVGIFHRVVNQKNALVNKCC